jgi:uncharacterized membrane protein
MQRATADWLVAFRPVWTIRMTEFDRFSRLGAHLPPAGAASRLLADDSARAIDLKMIGNRSLSERDAWRIVLAIAAILSIGAIRALVLGAWPIAAFIVADALLFGGMMIFFVRRPPAQERLMIRDGLLRLEQSWPGGARIETTVHGVWLERAEASTGEVRLHLRVGGRRLGVATMLSLDERREVAYVVQRALKVCA